MPVADPSAMLIRSSAPHALASDRADRRRTTQESDRAAASTGKSGTNQMGLVHLVSARDPPCPLPSRATPGLAARPFFSAIGISGVVPVIADVPTSHPSASWSSRISRVGALKALHAGMAARAAGVPVGACPFLASGEGVDSIQQFMAHWWVKGWRRGGDNAHQTNT